MLTANELGEKGESRFKEICADAQLICNKSDRDLAGWDFIVEFPFNHDEGGSLDSRRKQISCHIQVKTLRESSNRFDMRLSSAEHLAKEAKPSFIYIFKVNEQLEFVDSFLIHMLDEPMAIVLKRLRKESALPSEVKINKKKITLPVNKNSVRIKPTGSDLRSALLSACGADMGGYISTKANQLESMGFEGRPYELKATFHLGSDEELIDAFLGIKRDIKISNVQVFQTRFGIRLTEITPEGDGIVNINLSPSDHCAILIRRSALDSPSVFGGDMFVPYIHGVPVEKLKGLIKSDYFSIEFTQNSSRLTTNIDASITHTIYEWLNYWRALQIVVGGKGVIQIIPSKTGKILNFNFSEPMADLDISHCEYITDVCEKAIDLLNKAGVIHQPAITLVELEENATQLLLISALLRGESCFKQLTTKKATHITSRSSIEVVNADFVVIGNLTLAYYGVVTFDLKDEDDCIRWTATQFEPREFCVIHNFPEQYDNFLEKAKITTQISNLMARKPFVRQVKVVSEEDMSQ
jgi:hypothetical protein